MKRWIDKLKEEHHLTTDEYKALLCNFDKATLKYANEQAQKVCLEHFSNKIYIRGLIEISNFCKNDCFYCGIRKSNGLAERYRLSKEEILNCCENGYKLGFRTFVLQGGEDPFVSDKEMTDYISSIHAKFPDCAITLSIGEKSYETYKKFYEAGATRFLLRHETYNLKHYGQLHPSDMSGENRIQCLRNLKEIGFQTGTGIMVGTPKQRVEHIIEDIQFIEKLRPEMIGMGPFIPHPNTPFKNHPSGNIEMCLLLLSIFRLMNPNALIPATTALASLNEDGRIRGILAGANVVMPNLSPINNRSKYELYTNKAALGAESAEGLKLLNEELLKINYTISYERGDYIES